MSLFSLSLSIKSHISPSYLFSVVIPSFPPSSTPSPAKRNTLSIPISISRLFRHRSKAITARIRLSPQAPSLDTRRAAWCDPTFTPSTPNTRPLCSPHLLLSIGKPDTRIDIHTPQTTPLSGHLFSLAGMHSTDAYRRARKALISFLVPQEQYLFTTTGRLESFSQLSCGYASGDIVGSCHNLFYKVIEGES